MGVKIKSALSSAISFSGTPKIGSITCIGSGGPFDVREGNSSLLLNVGINNGKRSILVDCGPMVYATLSRMELITEVDAIIITSCSESSMGSLNTLVSHLHYAKVNDKDRVVKVLCADHMIDRIKNYLLSGGLDDNMVIVASSMQDVNIRFYETSPTEAAFILSTGTTPPVHIVHSGSTTEPVFDKLKSELYTLRADPTNVIIFHEASVFEDGTSCNYEKLSEWSEVFKNFFIFGHNKEDGSTITFNERYMRSFSTSEGQNEFNIEKTTSL